jgi:uncharacterized protein (TIRG00374 family)
MEAHTRRTFLTFVKLALALAILVYLYYRAREPIAKLLERSIDWKFLIAAFFCSLTATSLTFVRWHLLIRALDIRIHLVETLRLGALGFTLNFVSPGSVGGDFFKAIFLAHGQPGRRTEAVASVIADRVTGLLTMLAFASCGIMAAGLLTVESETLHLLCQAILAMAAIGWIGFLSAMFIGPLTGPRVRHWFESLPFVGKTIGRLLGAVALYRSRKRMVLAAFGVSLCMVVSFVSAFYLIARGLPIHAPTWREHMVIVPSASLVGAIPMTPSGLGTTEYALDQLYLIMPGGSQREEGDGFLVGFGRRVNDIVVAVIGLTFYLTHRREMKEVMEEAEHLADDEPT